MKGRCAYCGKIHPRGGFHTPETRKQMSEALKASWARRLKDGTR